MRFKIVMFLRFLKRWLSFAVSLNPLKLDKNDFVINLQSPNETCTVAPVLKQETHDFADSNLFMPPESFQSVQMRAR